MSFCAINKAVVQDQRLGSGPTMKQLLADDHLQQSFQAQSGFLL